MKFTVFAAVAAAAVVPEARGQQLLLNEEQHGSLREMVSGARAGVQTLTTWLRESVVRAQALAVGLDSACAAGLEGCLDVQAPPTAANQTIYELLATSNDTTQFAALVDRFPDLVALLNATGTAANYTVFVPVDAAFAKLPAGLPNSTAALRQLVHYHVVLGATPFSTMFTVHTLPTLATERLLDGEAQRLRVHFEKKAGLSVNFDSSVVAKDLLATNGVVHAIDSVVLSPRKINSTLTRVPEDFSTYLLAMQRTGLAEQLHTARLHGTTVLAPSNAAFTKLGPNITEFLFDSPAGLKYLDALLKYSVVPRSTVYTDTYYGPAVPDDGTGAGPGPIPVVRRHYDLPTLLAGASVSINVTSYPGYTSFLVNTISRVDTVDRIVRNGVVQEVGSVVFPPAAAPPFPTPGFPWWKYKRVESVADVIERLAPYVDADDDVPANDDVMEL